MRVHELERKVEQLQSELEAIRKRLNSAAPASSHGDSKCEKEACPTKCDKDGKACPTKCDKDGKACPTKCDKDGKSLSDEVRQGTLLPLKNVVTVQKPKTANVRSA